MAFAEGTPTVTVELGGKSFTLGFTWAAKRRVRDYFRSLGRDADSGIHEEDYTAAMVWASMDKEDRDGTSVDQIQELINPRNEQDVAEKLRELIRQSEPEEPEGNGKPAAVETPTAGPRSRSAGQSESMISA